MAQPSGLEAVVGAVYEGALDYNGKYTGAGTLKYPNGITYTGTFLDGQFHGEGELHFPNGAIYASVWREGKELDGSSSYEWEDGLPFNIYQEWNFLQGFDRRFWPEHQTDEGHGYAKVPFQRSKKHVQTQAGVPVVSQLNSDEIGRAVQGLIPRPKPAVPSRSNAASSTSTAAGSGSPRKAAVQAKAAVR